VIASKILDAQLFIESIDLSGVPCHSGNKNFAPQFPRFIPKVDEDQSIVVGSQLLVFAKGVEGPARRAIQNAVLLAQLAAQKKDPPDDYEAWHRTYFDVLSAIGWLIQERSFSLLDGSDAEADVHEAALQLASALMGGPATAAYQIVAATIGALQKLQESDMAIKIFRRETERRQTVRFQIGAAEKDRDGELSVSLMAFRLHASMTLTQVLFFKFKSKDVRLEHFTTRVGVNQDILEKTAGVIADKVAEYSNGYVRMLEI
jgi:hypothetical protein